MGGERVRGRSRHKKARPGIQRQKCCISFCLLLVLLAGICVFFVFRNGKTETDRVLAKEKMPREVSLEARDIEKWQELLYENRISEEFREGLESFAFESASLVLRQEGGNVNYSPLSASYALALAGCGACGETEAEILARLHMDSREELAIQCQKLYQWLYYSEQWAKKRSERYGGSGSDEGDAITIGNSVWVSDSAAIEKEYQKLASCQFFAPCLTVDFKSPEVGAAMGEWIAQKTNQTLPAPVNPDPDNRISILNTLYFYGGWRSRFAKDNTKEDIFTLSDGERLPCLFLNQTMESGRFREGDGFRVSYLKTADSQVIFLLPHEGRRPEDFLGSPELLEIAMNPDAGEWKEGEITWRIPRFSVKSSINLVGFLQALGTERMFGEDAEFGGISKDPLWISDMRQETFISMDESGVEGAAYTVMETEAAAIEREKPAHVDMILDRPFLYGIRTDSGIWLFLGIYRQPDQENP